MDEAYVELECPECQKGWSAPPTKLPDSQEPFDCPDCGERRPLSEFTRTGRDLEVLEEMGG